MKYQNNSEKKIEDKLWLYKLFITFLLNPSEIIKYSRNNKLIKIIAKIILLNVTNGAFFISFFTIVNNNKHIYIKFVPLIMPLLSIIYVPYFCILFMIPSRTFREDIRLSFISTFTILSTLLILNQFIFLVFLVTEFYLFYYMFLGLGVIFTIYFAVYLPLKLYKGKIRIFSVLLSFLSIFLINSSFSFLLLKTNSTDEYDFFVDPILKESLNNSQDNIETMEYITSNMNLLCEFMSETTDDFNFRNYELIKSQIKTIIDKEYSVQNKIDNTVFRRNKRVLLLTKRIIEYYRDLEVEFNRLYIIPDGYVKKVDEQTKMLNTISNRLDNDIVLSNEYKTRIDNLKNARFNSQEEADKAVKSIATDIEASYKDGEEMNSELSKISEEIEALNETGLKIKVNINAHEQMNLIIPKINESVEKLTKEVENSMKYLHNRFLF